MKTIHLRGLLWLLHLLGLGYLALSLEPGYLDFDNLPDTNFSCVGKVIGGYYADLETNCQMFHVCTIGQLDEPMDIRFLCLNGTVFDQETRVCERIDEVDCSKSEQFYSLNLELYGNTQPSVLEESADTDQPIIIKASTTTTTTTTTQRPKPKTTRPPTTTPPPPKVISTHHFPISSRPDIRFNPEEINISLNPNAPPNILTKSPDKQDLLRVLPNTQRPQIASTLKTKVPATPADINYGFTVNQEYHTEPQNYQYHHARHGQFRNQFKTTTYRTEHVSTTPKHIYKEPTTYRTTYVSSLKPVYSFGTEKPQRLQLPLPLLPTLPPLTFSSPAPFSLGHHVESKRYTNDHQPPPRIIISASASVSDASGRRLNYSLGTIGVTPVLEESQKSYDDYKDHDVVLDPFYHDVPKIKTKKRRKRQVQHSDVIRNEQEAVDVLKFLFDWYQSHQSASTVPVPISAVAITEINEELAPIVETPVLIENHNGSETGDVTEVNEDVAVEEKEVDQQLEITTKSEEKSQQLHESQINDKDVGNEKGKESDYSFKESDLFRRKSKFNIVGDVLSVTETAEEIETVTESSGFVPQLEPQDYIDDNYEAETHTDHLQDEIIRNAEAEKNATYSDVEIYEKLPETSTILQTQKGIHKKEGAEEAEKNVKHAEDVQNYDNIVETTTVLQSQEHVYKEVDEEIQQNVTHLEDVQIYDKIVETTTVLQLPEDFQKADSAEEDKKNVTHSEDAELHEIMETSTVLQSQEDIHNSNNVNHELTEETESPLVETTDVSTTISPTTTTITTENPLVARRRHRGKIRQEKIRGDNKKKYSSSYLSRLKPRVRSREKSRARTELDDVEVTSEEITSTINTTPGINLDIQVTTSKHFKIFESTSESETAQTTSEQEAETSVVFTDEVTTIANPNLNTVTEMHFEHHYENSSPPDQVLVESRETPKNEEEATTQLAADEAVTTELADTTEFPASLSHVTESHDEIEATNLTPVDSTTTETATPTTTTRPYRRNSSRPRRPSSRHRFSSTEVSPRPTRRRPVVETLTTTTHKLDSTSSRTEDVPAATDAPLFKSANPTQAESSKESLHTTPLSMTYKMHVRKERLKTYIFNCFGKPVNRFYSDPRDCRLFHYCTGGYTKNQLLDMKFVCDLGTYFDEDKLICTKEKPKRCL